MTNDVNAVPVDKQAESVKALANAVALVTNTVRQIAGDDIASNIQGQALTEEVIASLTVAKIQKHLAI